jgi:hypothetical protein
MRFVGVRFLLFGILFVAIAGLVVMGLWNLLIPPIFGLHDITFWQALGLLALSRILFGGFRGWGRGMHRARFARGWNSLTPEEQQRFRAAMGPRCGGGFEKGAAPAEQGR